jgi:Transposase DDE domain group 1
MENITSNTIRNIDTKISAPASEVQISDTDGKPVFLSFGGPELTSDAGVLLLKEVEEQVGIIEKMASVIADDRDARYVKHTLTELLMQRAAQISCGYEDANDCNPLRTDPVFKMTAGRSPETGNDLCSQPTMSRFENSVSRKDLYRLAVIFAEAFVASYASPPPVIVLDFDDTEDKVFGTQQHTLFNGYYRDYCYLPLHVYEGLSGRLITAILKPGKRCDGKAMLSIVKRVAGFLRERWPETLIIFRGDSHFAYPEVFEYIEASDSMMYVTGLTANPVLMREARDTVIRAVRLQQRTGRDRTVLFHSFYYQAQSWSHPRRVVVKAEATAEGRNIRFIVTDMVRAKASVLYRDIYAARGQCELYIKDHKLYLKSDRTSCHRFEANQFRLFLHSAAYVLLHSLKTEVLRGTEFANATFETIRTRILKAGAAVRELKTRIRVQLPECFPLKDLLIRSFRLIGCIRSPG